MLIKNKLDLIGDTPLVYLPYYSKKYNCNIYAKLEKYNLTYSSKDRMVKNIIINAINNNKINKSTTIIEVSSGNTAISLACICSILSIKCILIIQRNTSKEKIDLIKAYNGKIIFVDNLIQGYKLSRKLNKQMKNSFLLSQFESVDNINAHYNTTAQEIINDLNNIDTFISPYGTAGSIIGISKKLKEYSNKIKTVCVTLDNKIHHVEGVYSMLKTPLLDERLIDKIIQVNDVDVYKTQKEIVKKEGLFLGLSSALSLLGAIKYIKNNNVKNIVVLCPDGGERYLSNKYIFGKKYSKNEVIKDIEYIYDNLLSHKDFVNDEIFFKYGISINQIINIRKLLYLDAKAIYNNDPACDSVHQVIKVYNSFFAILSYRIANIIYKNKSKEIARIISEYAKSKTSIDIHPQAKIGKSFAIDHGVGVVIGQTSVIKDNVTLYHGVTLGAKSLNGKRKLRNIKRHPTILNNVTIYANATILGGNTTIGNNCIIGTNKIVTDSLKDNTILK